MVQIRRGKRDHLGIIFHITPLKRMLQPIIWTISPRRFYWGITAYVFFEKWKKILWIILNSPSYLELCWQSSKRLSLCSSGVTRTGKYLLSLKRKLSPWIKYLVLLEMINEFFTCVRNWYQFFTPEKKSHQFFTGVTNIYQFFTRQKLSTWEIWAQILNPKIYRNWLYVFHIYSSHVTNYQREKFEHIF